MPSHIPYQDPIDQGPLIQDAPGFRILVPDLCTPVRNGIPVFLPEDAVKGPNARYQKLYDRFAPFYDLSTRLYACWRSDTDATRRQLIWSSWNCTMAPAFWKSR